MANGFNRVLIVGNLGDEPTVKTTNNGSLVANLSIACNEPRKDAQTGQYTDHVEWFKVVCFGKVAEIAQNYAHKGTLLHIEGKLRNREYVDKDNIKRYVTEIVCEPDGLLLLSKKEGGNTSATNNFNQAKPMQTNANANRQPQGNFMNQQGYGQHNEMQQGYGNQAPMQTQGYGNQAPMQTQGYGNQAPMQPQGYGANAPVSDDPLPF